MPFSLSNFRYLPGVLQMAHKICIMVILSIHANKSAEKGMKYGFFSAKNRERDKSFCDIGIDLGTATGWPM